MSRALNALDEVCKRCGGVHGLFSSHRLAELAEDKLERAQIDLLAIPQQFLSSDHPLSDSWCRGFV